MSVMTEPYGEQALICAAQILGMATGTEGWQSFVEAYLDDLRQRIAAGQDAANTAEEQMLANQFIRRAVGYRCVPVR